MPHEGKLPHADVISDRLQTLVALSSQSEISNLKSQIVVTSVTALLQKTFPPGEIQKRTRTLNAASKIAPLDLIEWLEEQGYEPEAQVTQKGEIALRGGILDVFPPTSPWPVRLEFFGDELESLRHFDPLTQISREEIVVGHSAAGGRTGDSETIGATSPRIPIEDRIRNSLRIALATLLDYLPRETIFLLCEPEQLAVQADEYAQQVPADDPFFISWQDFLTELNRRGFTSVETCRRPAARLATASDRAMPQSATPQFDSLDAFRPLAERAPEPQIAEAQRREFFQQLHRWLRQDYAVHVFCNNDGERQRFEEIWKDYGLVSSRGRRSATSRRTCNSHRRARARISFATRRNWSSSPTRKFSAATKSSVRAG